MSERNYWVLCDDNCKFEAMTKQQVIAAIAEATGATPTQIDDAFITKLKEQNKGSAVKLWIGTTAEFNAIATKETNCFYIKTDGNEINELKSYVASAVDAKVQDILNVVYPVGSIFMSAVNLNPSAIFGGVWEAWGAGRVPVGVGTGTDTKSEQKTFAANETGGNYKKKLTITEIPDHRHSYEKANGTQESHLYTNHRGEGGYVEEDIEWYSSHNHSIISATAYSSLAIYDANAAQVTQDEGFSLLNPYITCYMWKRTA